MERLQNILVASNLDEVIVVLGAHSEALKPYVLKHKKIKLVYNKDYNLGQTSSFKAGLRAVSPLAQGIMALPIDFPKIETATIDTLLGEFKTRDPLILIPVYGDRKGHPPVFHQSLIKELSTLKDDEGLNVVVHRHADKLQLCPVNDEGVVLSFNTREEFEKISSRQKNG